MKTSIILNLPATAVLYAADAGTLQLTCEVDEHRCLEWLAATANELANVSGGLSGPHADLVRECREALKDYLQDF